MHSQLIYWWAMRCLLSSFNLGSLLHHGDCFTGYEHHFKNRLFHCVLTFKREVRYCDSFTVYWPLKKNWKGTLQLLCLIVQLGQELWPPSPPMYGSAILHWGQAVRIRSRSSLSPKSWSPSWCVWRSSEVWAVTNGAKSVYGIQTCKHVLKSSYHLEITLSCI